jgi:CubicO group peptidase (beta-lactamase class C family)
VLARGWGQADLRHPARAVDERTLFKVASLSKAMTALAVALLVDDGLLAWDAPLGRAWPELQAADPAVAALSARQLLSHQARLDLGRLEPLLWPQPNAYRAADLLAGLKALARDPRPVPGFHYSNVGYALLGELIARASGQRFGEFLSRRVFAPLGMDCVVGAIPAAEQPRLAQPHALVAGQVQTVRADPDRIDEGLDAAAGGVRCSALGLGTWLRFQLDRRAFPALPVSDASWQALRRSEAITRSVVDAAGRPLGLEAYGLGLQLQAEPGGAWRFDHFGGLAGVASTLSFTPAEGSGFALLLNRADAPAREWLAACLRGARCPGALPAPLPPAQPTAAAEQPLPAATARRLAGRWQDPWLGEVRLCPGPQGLALHVLASPRLVGRVAALADGRLALLWGDASVQSDAQLRLAGGTLQLSALGPASDFDFSALRLRRVGACPPAG